MEKRPGVPNLFRARLRFVVLIVASLEFAPVAWILVQTLLEATDWSRPYAYEIFWIPGLLGAPSLLALLLAACGRGLGWVATLCFAYAMVFLFFLGIDQVATVLKQYGNARVRIAGYADARGSDPANAQLGQARADAVKAALVAKGIDAGRIDTTTGGESDPVATNATAPGQFENRRTELVVLSR